MTSPATPGRRPFFRKLGDRRAPSAVLNLNLKHAEFLKGCLPPPPTASTLIITREKALAGPGVFWREPGCQAKAARSAEEKAERVSRELRRKSGRGGCTRGGPGRPGRSPSCRPRPGTASLRHFAGSAVPSVPLTALFFDLENRRR